MTKGREGGTFDDTRECALDEQEGQKCSTECSSGVTHRRVHPHGKTRLPSPA